MKISPRQCTGQNTNHIAIRIDLARLVDKVLADVDGCAVAVVNAQAVNHVGHPEVLDAVLVNSLGAAGKNTFIDPAYLRTYCAMCSHSQGLSSLRWP